MSDSLTDQAAKNPHTDTFIFQQESLKAALKETEMLADALNDRLDKIIDKFRVGHQKMPIISDILSITNDGDELKKLAKALDRVADIVPILNKNEDRQNFLKHLSEDPDWIAGYFGDLSKHAESIEAGFMTELNLDDDL